MNRLGIIDWGIGGISIYRLIKEQIGDVPITYFSDTGVTPYGKMTRVELADRLNAVISFLKQRGVSHLVVGCNAASTALPYLDSCGLEIEGVIEPAVAMTARLKPKRLGLIGGRRTVLSGVYRRAFVTHGIEVRQRIAQPLSGLIESGDVSSMHLENTCKQILSPLRNCSHILLACTHYPAVLSLMKARFSEVVFVDPAIALVNRIASWKFGATTNETDTFLTSGDPRKMKIAAIRVFGVEIREARKVRF